MQEAIKNKEKKNNDNVISNIALQKRHDLKYK